MNAPAQNRRFAQRLAASGLWLAAAKVTFLLAGYVTSMALSRLVDASTFGNYGVLARIVAVPNMVIVQSLSFAVSRPLAREYAQGMPSFHALRRRGFALAASLGALFGLGLLAGAGLISDTLHDPQLATPLRLLAPISLLYALYAVNIGTLNAGRAFYRQAGLDIFMSTTKAALIITAGVIGWGLAGLSAAFTLASASALLLSVALVRAVVPLTPQSSEQPKAFAGLILALLATTAASQTLLSTDLLLLKRFALDDLQRASVGHYAAAQLIALVPYSLLNAVNLLIFPLIASLDVNDPAQVDTRRRYISRAIEVILLLVAGLAAVISGGAQQVMTLIFPASYGQAAQDLHLLAFGYSGYAVGLNAVWILNSAGRAGLALGLVGAVLVVAFGSGLGLIPIYGHWGAAMAVLISGIFAAALGLGSLAQVFGARASWQQLGKITAAAAITTACGLALSTLDISPDPWVRRAVALVELGGLAVLFVGLLAIMRGVSRGLLDEVRGKNHVTEST